jgi:GT2 family glycosyltransferase
MQEQDTESDDSGHHDVGRPRAVGKFIFAGQKKLLVRGVTYGAFQPDAQGNEYHDAERIAQDFAMMVVNGVNTVRIPHTTPPRSLLDEAHRHGLKVMIGLSVEQEIGYFIDRKKSDIRRIDEALRSRVHTCARHPALLCYALGNEIPASIARWIGHRRVERLLERMYRIVKQEDPDGLVTYVNYPTTEYLQLPFLDLLSFNVYLEARDRLAAYLARLQNIAGDRPLMMSELGLDAMRNGEEAQAKALDWQIRTSFEAGCAGVFIFSWTDEWYRAGAQVDDWAFGLTNIEREPRRALDVVHEAFADPFASTSTGWPMISVVVCSHNGRATIRECCESLTRLDYPNFEVIIVDDGSTDGTGDIAAQFDLRVVRTDHEGLGNARNIGATAARGDIVAYLDDDACPDEDWLRLLVTAFENSDVVAAGGPNVSPPGDGWFAQCVDHAPGNPAHVLITDSEAEQLPGCNLAIRRATLEEIGGFDTRFRAAGDDVDVCWRLSDHGGTLCFSAGAMVLHHRRPSLSAYLVQQVGYGVAESLLRRKWQNDNATRRTSGTVYASGRGRSSKVRRARIYHGVWGQAPFQSVYDSDRGRDIEARLVQLLYTATLVLSPLAIVAIFWRPLQIMWPLLAAGILLIFLRSLWSAIETLTADPSASRGRKPQWVVASTLLHMLQPLARLWGRLSGIRCALRPADRLRGWQPPRTRVGWVWSETWIDPDQRIAALEDELSAFGVPLTRGGSFDGWDLEIHGGVCGGARLSVAVEDHSGAAQMIRYRLTPKVSMAALAAGVLLVVLAIVAFADNARLAALFFALGGAVIFAVALRASGRATAWGLKTLNGLRRPS